MGKISPSLLRTVVFGVEDSVVSTVGLLSGIAAAGIGRTAIFTTGVILVLVEAFSMAVGEFLSERTEEEYSADRDRSGRGPLRDGVAMFVSYLVSGLIPLSFYAFMPVKTALPWSIALSLVALFALGSFGARLSGRRGIKQGIRMLVIGGLAIAVGIVAGEMVKTPFV